MAFTLSQLKQVRDAITNKYNLDTSAASKITGALQQNPDFVKSALAGDLSAVPTIASALGINTDDTAGNTEKTAAASHTAGGSDGVNTASHNKPVTTSKKITQTKTRTKQNKADTGQNNPIQAQKIPVTTQKMDLTADNSEILPADTFDGLPAGVPDLIYGFIEDFCRRENIEDLKKERQTMWKALCMELGACIFKKSKILHDVQKEKTRGGIYYDYTKLSALCSLWASLCFKYTKVPTIDDFARFAGVSDVFLYGTGGGYDDGAKLTPPRASLLKKLHDLQEGGLASMIVDGRQNPTGALAALNHWHGWTQTREVIHTTAAGVVGSSDLPKLTDNII